MPDLPTRNAAHWLNSFAWGFQQTQNSFYRDRVVEMAELLISQSCRPQGYAFRNIPTERIAGNGLIGQAWVMEALITASETLGTPRYAQVATEVFEQHAFDDAQSLWRILHPSGAIQQIHPTLNQQIWFAAMGARLAPFGAVSAKERVRRFLDGLDHHIHLLREGLLGMRIAASRPRSLSVILRAWKNTLKAKLRSAQRPTFSYYETSVGYHAFAMYGLALLKPLFPDHPFWQTPQFQRALRWTYSDSHKRALKSNRFAMGYNPSGFEVPYILSVFRPLEQTAILEQSRWWLTEQVRRHYDPNTGKFSRNTYDEPTLTARIYEATRLPDEMLDMTLEV